MRIYLNTTQEAIHKFPNYVPLTLNKKNFCLFKQEKYDKIGTVSIPKDILGRISRFFYLIGYSFLSCCSPKYRNLLACSWNEWKTGQTKASIYVKRQFNPKSSSLFNQEKQKPQIASKNQKEEFPEWLNEFKDWVVKDSAENVQTILAKAQPDELHVLISEEKKLSWQELLAFFMFGREKISEEFYQVLREKIKNGLDQGLLVSITKDELDALKLLDLAFHPKLLLLLDGKHDSLIIQHLLSQLNNEPEDFQKEFFKVLSNKKLEELDKDLFKDLQDFDLTIYSAETLCLLLPFLERFKITIKTLDTLTDEKIAVLAAAWRKTNTDFTCLINLFGNIENPGRREKKLASLFLELGFTEVAAYLFNSPIDSLPRSFANLLQGCKDKPHEKYQHCLKALSSILSYSSLTLNLNPLENYKKIVEGSNFDQLFYLLELHIVEDDNKFSFLFAEVMKRNKDHFFKLISKDCLRKYLVSLCLKDQTDSETATVTHQFIKALIAKGRFFEVILGMKDFFPFLVSELTFEELKKYIEYHAKAPPDDQTHTVLTKIFQCLYNDNVNLKRLRFFGAYDFLAANYPQYVLQALKGLILAFNEEIASICDQPYLEIRKNLDENLRLLRAMKKKHPALEPKISLGLAQYSKQFIESLVPDHLKENIFHIVLVVKENPQLLHEKILWVANLESFYLPFAFIYLDQKSQEEVLKILFEKYHKAQGIVFKEIVKVTLFNIYLMCDPNEQKRLGLEDIVNDLRNPF